jgi:predicted ribosome quality control (RQC) complex YloA/Tae2 family protein
MPFDGLVLRAVKYEITEKLVGGRVEKAAQPERDEIVLHFRNNYNNYRLLISASASYARVHLTGINKPNPERAPMFCMLLRKHLIGGKLLGVEQPGLERVLDMRFGVMDELGLPSELTLHVEVMGRHSNAVLAQKDGRIIDALKRVTEEKSRVREVLPGIPYAYPPAQGKLDPLEADAAGLAALLLRNGGKPMEQALSGALRGIAQATASEMLLACGLNPQLSSKEYTMTGLTAACEALVAKFSEYGKGRFEPVVIERDGEAVDFLPFHSALRINERPCAGISAAAEAYFAARDLNERLRQKSAGMRHALSGALSRARRKLEKREDELRASEDLAAYRMKGELLTANLHAIRKGQAVFEAEDYYSQEGGGTVSISIELDPALTPSENAQRYFKRYAKAKTAREKLAEQIAAANEEIDYVEGLLQSIESCSAESELDEIRAELAAQGYMKEQAGKAFRKAEPSKPRHYRTGGCDIYVGRNNAQNDFLTLKFARADDVWMHAKKTPGSHVIVRASGGAVPDDALYVGAMLAAYYSKARSSSSVPVDYTQKRNVRKPAGARPGYVIYMTNRTISVTPDEAFVNGLKALEE